jgi:hypothetical protein
MPDDTDERTPETTPPRPHPPGWTASDAALEARLEADEARIAEEEKWIRRNWRLALAVAVLLALTISALVVSVIALNRDIEAVARAEPKDDSVSTAALQSGSVTADKIAAGAVGNPQLATGSVTTDRLTAGVVVAGSIANDAVTAPAIAARAVGNAELGPESVGTKKLIPGAVTGAKVAGDTLTGDNIVEGSLGQVPTAASAETADRATNAVRLGGIQAGEYLHGVEVAQARSADDLQPVKQLSVGCPAGTEIVSGGATADGAPLGEVAIAASTPNGNAAWLAVAVALEPQDDPWQLVVTAICAAGGEA